MQHNLKLSKRLQAIYDMVPQSNVIADIGSDHAFLPIALVLNGKVTRAYASEVNEGPYEASVKNIEKHGVFLYTYFPCYADANAVQCGGRSHYRTVWRRSKLPSRRRRNLFRHTPHYQFVYGNCAQCKRRHVALRRRKKRRGARAVSAYFDSHRHRLWVHRTFIRCVF